MIVADILFYFLIVLGFYLIFLCYWLAAVALFPLLVENCRNKIVRAPFVTGCLGVVLGGPLLIIGFLLVSRMGNGVLQIFGLVILLIYTFFALIGSAGLARHIGLGLSAPVDAIQPWRAVLRGGIVLGITFLLPLVGWFAVLPLTLTLGVGAFIRAYWSRANKVG
jgi:hypothetical protein